MSRFSSANRYKIEGEDSRNKLFFEFVKFVDLFQPKAIVIENVSGIVTNNSGYAKDKIYEIFSKRGYSVNHKILIASDYGVPQKRKRNFFVMIKYCMFDFDSIVRNSNIVTVKDAIVDLHFEDIAELNGLPPTPFEPSSVQNRKLDNYGRLTTEGRLYYSSYAYKKVQVKFLPDILEIYEEDGKLLITVPRLSGSKGARYINWRPYIRLLAVKPAAMYNFSFLDLFTDTQMVEKITKLNSFELKEFLEKFADMIDNIGLDIAIQNVKILLKKE